MQTDWLQVVNVSELAVSQMSSSRASLSSDSDSSGQSQMEDAFSVERDKSEETQLLRTTVLVFWLILVTLIVGLEIAYKLNRLDTGFEQIQVTSSA